MKRIVIPTDFSKNAWNAATYALELFKDEPCTFYLAHAFTAQTYVSENFMMPEPGDVLYETAKQASEDGLDEWLQRITTRSAAAHHTFETISLFNFVVEGLQEFIEEEKIDLVVMGTKGESNAHGIFAGSVAVSAMKHIKSCPVLVIPSETPYTYVKEIVFPTDYKTDFKNVDIETLVDMARRSKAHVSILLIYEEELTEQQLTNKIQLKQFLSPVENSTHEIRDKKVLEGLHEYIDGHDSGMVAFVNKQHNFFEGFFSTPIAKDLGYYSKIPILALHEHKA